MAAPIFASEADTLYARLAAWAVFDPDAPAILSPRRKALSFSTLIEQLDASRTFLNSCGLGRGDRIALHAPRGPETAVAALAIASCSTCIPLNSNATLSESIAALRETGASALLLPGGEDVAARDAAQQLGLALLEMTSLPDAAAGEFQLSATRSAAAGQTGLAQPGDIALLMRTSGTTATAKLVPVGHTQILARADKTQRLHGLVAGDRCLNLMPLCYMHGLNSGLTGPLLTGGSVICPSQFDRETFLECMCTLEPDWYTAGSTYHQAIHTWLQQDPQAIADHGLRFVRSGSSPLPARVQQQLEEMLGVPVVESYSSSETGTITTNPVDGLRKKGTVGISPDGDIKVVDEQGQRLAPGTLGEVLVRGPGVIEGYEKNPDGNRQAFQKGWYHTGDLGQLDEAGYLKLTGRAREMINRGGEKVYPSEVDAALLEHPAIAEAVTFAVPHPTLHEEIAAAVVLNPDSSSTEEALRRFLYERLSSFKVPRRIVITSTLHKGPTGKVLRQGVAERYGLNMEVSADAASEEQSTAMERALFSLWCDVLKRDHIGLDDDFFLLGGDSLLAVDLLLRVEQAFQIKLPLQYLLEAATVRQMALFIQHYSSGDIKDIVGLHTNGGMPPLFGVAGRFGYTLRLMRVGRELGPDQPFYGMQPPDMDWESAGISTITEMAAYYIGLIKSVQTQGPYRLLGSSFGGLMVFEMAQQLHAAGEVVEFLGLVDTKPSSFRRGAITYKPRTPVPDPTAPRRYVNEIEAAKQKVADTHVMARDKYLIEKPFAGELTFFYCEGEAISPRRDRRRYWRLFARGGVRMLPVPGLHGDIHIEPQFSALAKGLSACLADETQPATDIVSIFGQRYRLEKDRQGVSIRCSSGAVFPVTSDQQGNLNTANINGGQIYLNGWACDRGQLQPAMRVLVFLDGRYCGYCGCGIARKDLVRRLDKPGLLYAGFRLCLAVPRSVKNREPLLRVFALSHSGHVAELNYSRVRAAHERR